LLVIALDSPPPSRPSLLVHSHLANSTSIFGMVALKSKVCLPSGMEREISLSCCANPISKSLSASSYTTHSMCLRLKSGTSRRWWAKRPGVATIISGLLERSCEERVGVNKDVRGRAPREGFLCELARRSLVTKTAVVRTFIKDTSPSEPPQLLSSLILNLRFAFLIAGLGRGGGLGVHRHNLTSNCFSIPSPPTIDTARRSVNLDMLLITLRV